MVSWPMGTPKPSRINFGVESTNNYSCVLETPVSQWHTIVFAQRPQNWISWSVPVMLELWNLSDQRDKFNSLFNRLGQLLATVLNQHIPTPIVMIMYNFPRCVPTPFKNSSNSSVYFDGDQMWAGPLQGSSSLPQTVKYSLRHVFPENGISSISPNSPDLEFMALGSLGSQIRWCWVYP